MCLLYLLVFCNTTWISQKHIICYPFFSHREELEKQTCYILFRIRFCTLEIYCFIPLAILVNMENKYLKDNVFLHVKTNYCVDNLFLRLPELWWSLMAIVTDIAAFMVMNPDLVKFDLFDRSNFTLWQDKMMFLLLALKYPMFWIRI